MFRNRSNAQRPAGKLLDDFKASFPHLGQRSHSFAAPPAHSLTDALDVAHPSRHIAHHERLKDHDPTPRANHEPWRFTPSLLDPNSFAFTTFANQPPGYYTPTPGGTNTLYHSQAGDLHTPGFSFGLGTPLSLPTSEGGLHAGQVAPTAHHHHHHHLHGFDSHAMDSQHHFQNANPFAMPSQHAQSFAPHQFTHQPSAFHQDPSLDHMVPEVDMQEHSPLIGYAPHAFDANLASAMPLTALPSDSSFRYHVTLNAPTAMIKQSDEVPVTYLNKGQAYSMSIVDTAPIQTSSPTLKYRTMIRISFEDEQQRQRPAACWQLWKEGRGTSEAHQRGGRLQAVEFVDPGQVSGGEVQGRPRVDLESSSFDGFTVTWTPVHNATPDCSLAVRFNFLSTDFSHSKGVKGIPVRLCAKTVLLTDDDAPVPSESPNAELCYCKVKLFRDHGAERKLSNDVAHVKKTIDKLKQQIAQVESGMKEFGKRKRSGSMSKSASQRPGKVPKHKRTWSMSSVHSASGGRAPAEEDLHIKLASLQDMFSSTRPVSVLYLKGSEQDDPDLHPVRLSSTPPGLAKIDTTADAHMWEAQGSQTGASSNVSPTPSSQSLHSEKRPTSSFQRPRPFPPPSRMSSNEWRSMPQTATGDLKGTMHFHVGADVPTKVQRPCGNDHALSGWIEALDVDQTYQPPPEPLIKPVACFFVQPRIAGRQSDDNYFRAVYLMERTVKNLASGIAMKINVEATKITRTIRVNKKGLRIMMDDDAVLAIPEQQDMTAEFHEIGTPPLQPMKREWDAGPTDIQVDGDISVIENVHSSGWELRLLY